MGGFVKKRKQLILGVDVGLHAAVALIDLDGKLVHIDSYKSPTLNELLEKISSHGNIFSVSTDKAKMPTKAKKIAASLGSREISPIKNLTKKKKRILIDRYLKEEKPKLDSHSKAALASAIFGYRRIMPKLKKLREKLEKEGREKDYKKVREKFILGEFRLSEEIKKK